MLVRETSFPKYTLLLGLVLRMIRWNVLDTKE